MVNQKVIYLPCQINPLIKFTRWALLVAGVIYGFTKYKKFHTIETALREEEERQRPMREAQLAREAKLLEKMQLKMLEEIFLGPSVETNQEESKETNQEESKETNQEESKETNQEESKEMNQENPVNEQ